MARKPAQRGRARPTGQMLSAGDEREPRSGPSPVLIATFLVLALFGGLVGWLALGDGDGGAALPSVSISLNGSADGRVEELMGSPKTAAVAPVPTSGAPSTASTVRRTLPVTISADGKLSLAPVPDPMLVEQTVVGPLPRIAEDGARPWHVYAHPAPPEDGRPKIALVISGMGLSEVPTRLAVQRLPSQVSLAFVPYGNGLQEWVGRARAAGHEVLLELPMEPYDFPENDPGPHALLTGLSAEENTNRLEWLLSRFSGYAGVINFFGGKFSTSEMALGPVMAELNGRGLMIVDNQSAARSRISDIAGQIDMPFVSATSQIDTDLTAIGIDSKLSELEKVAIADGFAAGVGSPLPLTIERISLWAEQLNAKGINLVPVTALIQASRK
ncbi:MAG: divergent polysaccharide deacetylase family protein [Alphaproteobacteria bacterium]|nr:divergent polysaccharide deacetylase family protein [Alphaproteobacteria bacterium]